LDAIDDAMGLGFNDTAASLDQHHDAAEMTGTKSWQRKPWVKLITPEQQRYCSNRTLPLPGELTGTALAG